MSAIIVEHLDKQMINHIDYINFANTHECDTSALHMNALLS